MIIYIISKKNHMIFGLCYKSMSFYTTLCDNLIKDKLIDLFERTFHREGSPYLTFLTSEKPKKACMVLSKYMWHADLFVGQHFHSIWH